MAYEASKDFIKNTLMSKALSSEEAENTLINFL